MTLWLIAVLGLVLLLVAGWYGLKVIRFLGAVNDFRDSYDRPEFKDWRDDN
jgi:hypothetical protein